MEIKWTQLLLEAIIVGIITVVLGYIVGFVTKPFLEVSLPEACGEWNKNYVMEVNLFLIGFLAHLSMELGGLNTWYCKHGHACMAAN